MDDNPQDRINVTTYIINTKKKKKKKKGIKQLQSCQDVLDMEEGIEESISLPNYEDSVSSSSALSEDPISVMQHLGIFDKSLQFDAVMKSPPLCTQESEESEATDKTINSPDQYYPYDNEVRHEGPIFGNNIRALDKYAATYELEKFDKNFLMIFNQENINNYIPRTGTEKDVESLKNTFVKYNFEIDVHNDLTKDEILEKLKILRYKDFTEYGCVAVVVLTHGSTHGLIRAKDREYSETEIINFFKTHDKPTLITKPKFLIIQACRGTRLQPAVPVMRTSRIRMDHDMDVEPYTLPVEADMLILHSSYKGSPSIRCEANGSWLIQTLCKKIDECASTLDVESILTEVKRQVAAEMSFDDLNRITNEYDTYKQMPVVTSTLIRKLYLRAFDCGIPTNVVEEVISPMVIRQDGDSRLCAMKPVEHCLCFLKYYPYILEILSIFLEHNPDDTVAQSYLTISNTFKDTIEFNVPKGKMVKVISEHIRANARSDEYYKYLYLDMST